MTVKNENSVSLAAIEKRSKIFGRIGKGFIYAMLTFWAVMVLFPFYYMILTSVKDFGAYNAEFTPKLFTTSPTIENYRTAFDAVPLSDYFYNTVIYTLFTTALMLIVSILAAFAFARISFKGKNIAFTLFLSLMMIPAELVVITNFVTITNLELRNTLRALFYRALLRYSISTF